ncbi:MAG TPA: InlB B-repeat-containing protein [Galbitalea sp.]|jgi:uncharacterized repeat protein (TIGR02543 family)
MSVHALVKRITARSRTRFTIVAGGIVVVIVAAAVIVGLPRAASAATPPFDPQDSIKPVASYTFDTANGATVADTSGKGNDAAWKGTPSYAAGISGNAAVVTSGANYVKLPLVTGQTDAASSFSYEFWMSEQSRTSYGPIVSNQNFAACNNKGMTLYNQTTPGVLQACWGQTSGGTKEYVTGASGNLVGAWHYVAVTVDRSANTATYYVDGVQTTTAPAGSITASTAFTSGLAFNIGGLSGSETDTSDGYTNASIDDFNFYNAVVPSSQVAADYVASRPNTVDYTVAFNGNGASAGATASEDMPAGAAPALTKNGFTRVGYQFAGWATSAAGPIAYADGQAVANLSTTSGATVTLYAVWNRYRAAGDTVAPILSYDFDGDTGSTITDSSGNGNAGTWSGSPSYATGVSGKGAYVNSPDGSSKGVNFFSLPMIAGKTDATSSFSYVFWLNESSASSDSPIVSNQDFTHCYDKGTTLYNTSGQPGVVRACFGQNGTSTGQNYLAGISSTSVIGDWHQVAIVVDRSAGTMTSYLDGQQAVQSTALTSAFTLASGFPFRVGAEGSGNDTVDGFVNAYIDDFDFYAAPITAAQIANDYAATKPNTDPTNSGSTLEPGFVTDTFRVPPVRAGGAIAQPIAGLWNGGAVTQYKKLSGDAWLSVDGAGTVTGTAPATASADPATITVQATDGTTTSEITLEVNVVGAADSPQLATATWNLWDAGSHVSDSALKDLAVIAANGLDIVGVQQDGGTVATDLATALGWYSVEGAGGVGIVSAYPVDGESKPDAADALPAVGVTAHTPGRDLRVWSVGLDSAAYGPEAACQGGVTSPADLVAAEDSAKRVAQARAVASAITTDVAAAAHAPVVLLGDLESPSSTDWTAATASAHCGVGAVDWPVPDQFADAGLTDSFRASSSDPATAPGTTWSPIVTTNAASGTAEPQDRIDYVDFAGKPLTVVGSNTLVAGFPTTKAGKDNSWTSDHRAVVTTFRLAPVPPPTVTVTATTVTYQVGAAPTASDLLTKAGAASPSVGAMLQIDQSAVDFTTAGTYTAPVTATDPSSGVTSAPVAVTVRVVPVVMVTLAHTTANVTLGKGEKLTEAKVEAALDPTLNVAGTITVDLSLVNANASGSYPVTVVGTDGFGFTGTAGATLTITVSAPSPGAPTSTAGGGGGEIAWTGVDLWLLLGVGLLLLLLGALVVGARQVAVRLR